MFCPNCGQSDQKAETYCRQCGEFLPNVSGVNSFIPFQKPEEQFNITLVLNFLSSFAGFVMAILLYIFNGRGENVHWSVFAAASILFCISVWQGVSFYNNWNLKKRYNQKNIDSIDLDAEMTKDLQDKNKEALPEPDFEDIVPPSIVEKTTKDLKEKVKRSTES